MRYRGVDRSAGRDRAGWERATGLGCRFDVAEVPPVPGRHVDVVLLLETMLAFEDKVPLLRAVAAALGPAGGSPSPWRRVAADGGGAVAMPAADTVWPVPLAELRRPARRRRTGPALDAECSPLAPAVAAALIGASGPSGRRSPPRSGTARRRPAGGARLWSDWLTTGRIRKFAVVAEKAQGPEDEPRRGPVILQVRPGPR